MLVLAAPLERCLNQREFLSVLEFVVLTRASHLRRAASASSYVSMRWPQGGPRNQLAAPLFVIISERSIGPMDADGIAT